MPTTSLGMGRFLNVNVEVWEEQHPQGHPNSQGSQKQTQPSPCPIRNCCYAPRILSALCPASSLLSTLSPPELYRVEVALCPKARVSKGQIYLVSSLSPVTFTVASICFSGHPSWRTPSQGVQYQLSLRSYPSSWLWVLSSTSPTAWETSKTGIQRPWPHIHGRAIVTH